MKCDKCGSKRIAYNCEGNQTRVNCHDCNNSWINGKAKAIDIINPPHYKRHPSGVECIQITEHMNFCLGNAVKYIWRAGLKDGNSSGQDLEKAIWYINREIERLRD